MLCGYVLALAYYFKHYHKFLCCFFPQQKLLCVLIITFSPSNYFKSGNYFGQICSSQCSLESAFPTVINDCHFAKSVSSLA